MQEAKCMEDLPDILTLLAEAEGYKMEKNISSCIPCVPKTIKVILGLTKRIANISCFIILITQVEK